MTQHPRSESAPTTAIVLAGGVGSRMGHLAKARPKHLLEVAGEPFICHQLRWLSGHGVTDVVVATAHLADQFEPVLGDGSRWGVRLSYSTETSPAGTGGALRVAAATLEHLPERLVVVNGDLLTDHDLHEQMSRAQELSSADVVLHLRSVPDARPFGSVVADPEGRVSAFLEKSAAPPTHEVNAGTYIVSRSVIESLPAGVVSLERDIFPTLVSEGRVVAYREEALWEDVGTPESLVRASRALVRRAGLSALVDDSAVVDPSATVSDGSAVGPRAVLERNARVVGSVVMTGAVVGAGSRLEGTVLAPGDRVPPGRFITGFERV